MSLLAIISILNFIKFSNSFFISFELNKPFSTNLLYCLITYYIFPYIFKRLYVILILLLNKSFFFKMIVHNFDPILIDFGLFQIRWYSIAYIFGIMLGWVYANKIISLTTKNSLNFKQISKSQFDDLIIYLIIGIILGGRLGYVFFYNLEYYLQNVLEIFKLWQGGMSFHGGLLGVVVSIGFFYKKKNINFFKPADIVSCVAPIGIFLGRIANFINSELYGKASHSSLGSNIS